MFIYASFSDKIKQNFPKNYLNDLTTDKKKKNAYDTSLWTPKWAYLAYLHKIRFQSTTTLLRLKGKSVEGKCHQKTEHVSCQSLLGAMRPNWHQNFPICKYIHLQFGKIFSNFALLRNF